MMESVHRRDNDGIRFGFLDHAIKVTRMINRRRRRLQRFCIELRGFETTLVDIAQSDQFTGLLECVINGLLIHIGTAAGPHYGISLPRHRTGDRTQGAGHQQSRRTCGDGLYKGTPSHFVHVVLLIMMITKFRQRFAQRFDRPMHRAGVQSRISGKSLCAF